jgi:aspartate aminotransferase
MINAHIKGRGVSPTLAINERSAELVRSGRDVYRMGLGQSPFPVPPGVVEALKHHANQKDYLPVRGLPELRSAIADYQRRKFGLPYEGEDILVGPGSKQLLFLLRLVQDATLVLPAPSWVSYEPQAAVLGKPYVWLPTKASDQWRLQPETLDHLARERPGERFILLLNYPCNPTGHTYREKHLAGLAEVARRHNILILSDEIYGELDHEGAHESMGVFYPEGTVVTAGLSKWCGAGGWRLGTASFPRERRDLLEAVAVVGSESFSAVSAPVQFAAVQAFQGSPEIDEYLRRSRAICRAVTRLCSEQLRHCGAHVVEPEGAFYLFPDFSPLSERFRARGITSSQALSEQLLEETGVAALPGSAFGRQGDLAIRIAPVNFDGQQAIFAADDDRLDEDFVRLHCPRTVEALNRICAWL